MKGNLHMIVKIPNVDMWSIYWSVRLWKDSVKDSLANWAAINLWCRPLTLSWRKSLYRNQSIDLSIFQSVMKDLIVLTP